MYDFLDGLLPPTAINMFSFCDEQEYCTHDLDGRSIVWGASILRDICNAKILSQIGVTSLAGIPINPFDWLNYFVTNLRSTCLDS
jgi:hypothetical protein